MAKKKKKKSPYGVSTPEQYRKKLAALEALYGSQKKAADMLGISTATFKRQKTGASVPKSAAKTNRLYAANQKKIQAPEMQEKIAKKQEAEAERKLKKELESITKVTMQSTRSWLSDMFSTMRTIMVNQVAAIAPYVKYNGQEKVNVQFTEGFDFDGKAAGVKRAKVWAIYTAFGSALGEMTFDIGVADLLIGSKMGLLDDIQGTWSITETNDYIQTKFGTPSHKKGRQKYIMTHYLGYQLY